MLFAACREITAPERAQQRDDAAKRLLNPSGIVVVYPDSMRGWIFYNDQTNAVCPTGTSCRMVQGPAAPPLGSGSAELYDSLATDGKALILPDYAGTRFDQITDLHYSTYRQTADAGNNLAISLQFNVDYDLTDAATGYQGRLVFEPYIGVGGNVPQNTWQTWDAKAGKWWGTRATVTRNGGSVANPCVQGTPCTWAQLLAAFPDVGVHSLYGAVVLKAGSGWPGFRGNVDNLTIAIAGVSTTFNFELAAPPQVSATPPDSLPIAYETLTDTISGGNHWAGQLLRDMVVLQFKAQTTTADKQAAISGVSGTIVGGRPLSSGEGLYLVRVPGDGTVEPLFAAIAQLKTLPQVALAMPEQIFTGFTTYQTSTDGLGAQSGSWRLNPDSAFGNANRGRWAVEAVNAPFAWGCSTGGNTRVGVLDMDLHNEGEIVANVDTTFYTRAAHTDNHGTRMASLIAAQANDGAGITGMMWNAKVAMADISEFRRDGQPVLHPNGQRKSDTSIILHALYELVKHGARVINLSVGTDSARSGPHTAAQDSARANYGWAFREVASYTPFGAPRPLWVLSAGNMQNSTDVYWNELTGAVDSLPNETLVVTGASSQAGQLLAASTGSGTIHVAAPGMQVAVSDGAGTATVSGSSPATAIVSGAAGLLFAFDSTITPDSARAWLLRAAVNSGRHAGSYPLLDVYGALRIAADRPGVPICGNRIWRSGDSLIVQRGGGGEVLNSSLGSPVGDLTVYHGGRRIDVDYSRSLVYTPAAGWQLTTPGAASTSPGGFYWSANGYDHDGVGSSWSIVSNGSTYAYWYDGNYNELQTVSMTLSALSSTRVSDCMWQTWRNGPTKPDSAGPYPRYECSMMGSTGISNQYREGARSGGAMSPDGRFTAMPVTVVEDAYTLSDWAPCAPGTFWATTGDPTAEHPNLCRQQFVASRPLSAFVVIADSATHTARIATGITLTERNLDWVAITENGREMALQSSRCTKSADAQFQTCSAGSIEWRSLDLANGTLGTSNFSATLAEVAQPSKLRGASLRALRESDTGESPDSSPSARALSERRAATARLRR